MPLSTESKVNSIIRYLDEVELQGEGTALLDGPDDAFSVATVPSTKRSRPERSSSFVSDAEYALGLPPTLHPPATPAASIVAETVLTGFRGRLDSLRDELAKKTRKIHELEGELRRAHTEIELQTRRFKKDADEITQRQQKELEVSNTRNSAFVQSMMEDKEMLMNRVEQLQSELNTSEERQRRRLKEAEERHQTLLQSLKAQLASQEKKKRAVWVEENTKKIKDKTLKALEPDITRLINQHRAEKKRLEEERDDELERRQQLIDRKDKELLECKAKFNREIETALLKEREAFQQQLTEHVRRLQFELEEQRRAHNRERELMERKLDDERIHYRRQLQQQETEAKSERSKVDTEKQDYIVQLEKEKNRIAIEKDAVLLQTIQKLKDEQELRLSEIQRQLKKNMDEEVEQKRLVMQAEMQAERDAQIDLIVSNLEDAILDEREKCRSCERQWSQKYTVLQRESETLRAQLGEANSRISLLQAKLEEAEVKLKARTEEVDSLKFEALRNIERTEGEVQERIRKNEGVWCSKYNVKVKEYTELVDSLQSTIVEVKAKLARVTDEKDKEIESILRQKENELDEINMRIQSALQKKDTHIQHLSTQLQKSEAKNRQVEDLLLQQNEMLCNGDLRYAS